MPTMKDVVATQKRIQLVNWHPHDTPAEHLPQTDQFQAILRQVGELDHEVIPKLPMFEVTNVYEYTKQRESKIYEDWPCLLLPIDMMWMEYRRGDKRTPSHVGASMMRNDSLIEKRKWEFPEVAERGKHVISLSAYFMQQNQVVGPTAMWDVALDERGAPLEYGFRHMAGGSFYDSDDNEDHNMNMLAKMSPFFQALAFMHCKNAAAVEESPPPKVSKKWEKKANRPLTRFHKLVIRSLKETIADGKGTSTTGIEKGIHIARGHFAEYGDEFGKGKLFGKYEGRFWIPAHVRGSKEQGIIEKDYEVRP